MPTCIATSPDGKLRYWPNISNHNSYTDVNIELKGQESHLLTDISPIGCVLSTTIGASILIQTQIVNNVDKVVYRALKTPKGWLDGICSRMSSLFFGSIPSSRKVRIFFSNRNLITYCQSLNYSVLLCTECDESHGSERR